MEFDKDYTEYWKHNISKPIDGLVIPDFKVVGHFLPYLKIGSADLILDLGCSFGRMHEVIVKYSKNVYGIDPDKFAVNTSKSVGYIDVKVGEAGRIGFENNFFDVVFSWAVFDVVDHFKALVEVNRVLKVGGRILFTGKNDNYFEDDTNAFVAEKNAYIKSFPNHFLDLKCLLMNSAKLGFKVEKLVLFPKRGDFGKLFYKEFSLNRSDYKGYEYLLILNKVGEVENLDSIKLDDLFSKTAKRISKRKGFQHASDLFKTIGLS